MKKKLLILAAAMIAALSSACSSGSKDSAVEDKSAEATEGISGAINVISREEGSGTRGAFTELFKVVDENDNDITTINAEITNSTSVMLSTVAGDPSSIGYVSLGSLSSDVKAVDIDGVAPTTDNIKAGTYSVARPFLVVYKDGSLSDLAEDFLSYIMSSDGQALINKEGYISVEEGESYTASGLSGKLVLSGSTSVSPVMEKLADAYKELNPDVTIEIQQTGSGAGITAATEDVCDFGMSSRDLKDEEKATLTSTKIAIDGIAVIVNNENAIDNITSDQIKQIYTGEITDWSQLK